MRTQQMYYLDRNELMQQQPLHELGRFESHLFGSEVEWSERLVIRNTGNLDRAHRYRYKHYLSDLTHASHLDAETAGACSA